ncbi:hypothetical protein [Sphaerotilus microaerophilus]|uniref:Uncharacterized protein n=1 Tax=Sphaerotilus microaerophilus TaxID=2914710 RepID=A0ABN6PR89_9BURK|nr:hypothetical protein [Sphaerotilus sp. FB-5]BDI07696.1 hypothetical protein CATMQ487_46660 [Sphaerotilus sp. FB-5]
MTSAPRSFLFLCCAAVVTGCAQTPAPVATPNATPATPVAAPAVETGLKEIGELAEVNGRALACQDLAAARRAKALMLAHAPKTARYGSAFDDGTQQSYLAVTGSRTACPEPAAQQARLDVLAQRLQAVLPAAPPAPAGPAQ